jgi:predicted ArsR family transcriptional regulator
MKKQKRGRANGNTARILDVLVRGPRLTSSIAEELGLKSDVVGHLLSQLKKRGAVTHKSPTKGKMSRWNPGVWQLAKGQKDRVLGPQTLTHGERVLIKNQTRSEENGVYVVGAQTIVSRLERLEKALANHNYASLAARLSAIEALLGVPGK